MSLNTILICLMASIVMVHGSLTPNCLQCLCEASTQNCRLNEGCHQADGGFEYCGPFLISHTFWLESGKPLNNFTDPKAPGAFKDCVLDYGCAVKAIKGYMKDKAKDCNGDGVVSCIDYVRIHKYGRNACEKPLAYRFKEGYETCAARINVD